MTKSNLIGERFPLAHSPEDTIYHGEEKLAVGKADRWLHCIPSPEAESEQEKGTDYKTSRATPSDIFPSA